MTQQRKINHYSLFLQRIPKDLKNDGELKAFLEDIYGPMIDTYLSPPVSPAHTRPQIPPPSLLLGYMWPSMTGT